jgi:hypothetical protein
MNPSDAAEEPDEYGMPLEQRRQKYQQNLHAKHNLDS